MLAFGRSILDTARSWVDQAQLVMPGYRDRIVTIYHDKSEGGMNLTMDQPTVDGLVARGQGGAGKLVESFVDGDGWRNHRWLRFRTATAGLDAWLTGLRTGYDAPGGGYPDLAGIDADDKHADAALPSYGLTQGRRIAVNERTKALVDLARQWNTDPADAFTDNSPSPPHPPASSPAKCSTAPPPPDEVGAAGEVAGVSWAVRTARIAMRGTVQPPVAWRSRPTAAGRQRPGRSRWIGRGRTSRSWSRDRGSEAR